jgi:adenosine deaminase CECR1
MEEYKKMNICVEICPLSNQMLRYYNDIRLHPIKALLTNGVKVSISSDDPSLFGTIGVSVDFYVASVGNLLGKRILFIYFSKMKNLFFSKRFKRY